MWAVLYKAIRILNATNDVYKLRRDVKSLVILFSVYVAFSFFSFILCAIGSSFAIAQPAYAITVSISIVSLILTILQLGLIITLIVLPASILNKIPEEPSIVKAVIVKDES